MNPDRFERSVRIRAFSMGNLREAGNPDAGGRSSDSQKNGSGEYQLGLLNEDLDRAQETRLCSETPVFSHRRPIGPVIVFGKRTVRKLLRAALGWKKIPDIDRLDYFNGKMLHAVTCERDLIVRLQDQITALRHEVRALNREVSELSREINDLKERENR